MQELSIHVHHTDHTEYLIDDIGYDSISHLLSIASNSFFIFSLKVFLNVSISTNFLDPPTSKSLVCSTIMSITNTQIQYQFSFFNDVGNSYLLYNNFTSFFYFLIIKYKDVLVLSYPFPFKSVKPLILSYLSHLTQTPPHSHSTRTSSQIPCFLFIIHFFPTWLHAMNCWTLATQALCTTHSTHNSLISLTP